MSFLNICWSISSAVKQWQQFISCDSDLKMNKRQQTTHWVSWHYSKYFLSFCLCRTSNRGSAPLRSYVPHLKNRSPHCDDGSSAAAAGTTSLWETRRWATITRVHSDLNVTATLTSHHASLSMLFWIHFVPFIFSAYRPNSWSYWTFCIWNSTI